MILEALRWWLAVSAIGVVAFPIVFVVFQRLPGRGFAFCKPVGLLLGGFSYWMVLSLHLMPNRPGTIIWALLPIAVVSVILARRHWDEIKQFAEEHASYITVVEVLFLAAFFTAAHLRSFIPEISGTEKPMDFMMLNAAFRSQFYPPEDPWLAGSGVSYYYFGYVIQAMTAKLAAVQTSVAFNLAIASTAAMAATAAFGLGYEIARLARKVRFTHALLAGVASMVLLVFMGNLVGAIEFGIANDVVQPAINDTVRINDLETAVESDACALPSPAGCILKYPSDDTSFWWWWRSTRVSEDGNSINEFPFFSFLLGDLHPHVMAIPFVLTAFALGLALWRSAGRLDLEYWQRRPLLLLLMALLAGGLGFLNTWDLPTFGFLLVALVLARNVVVERDYREALKDTAGFAVPLVLLSAILYSPFYFSFGSQASGFESVVTGATRPLHAILLWGPLIAANVALPFVVLSALKVHKGDATVAFGVPLTLLAGWLLLTLFNEGARGVGDAIAARGLNWLTYLFFGALFGAVVLALRRLLEQAESDGTTAEAQEEPASIASEVRASAPALVPVLVAMATGLLLILGAELFYVQDVFGSRLNTVFKLSYQAWLLLAISGGFSLWWLAARWRPEAQSTAKAVRATWAGAAIAVVVAAMLYPLGATLSRTSGLSGDGRTLDGLASFSLSQPADFAAIQWIRDRAGNDDRIIEGMGGQYSTAGRISAATGVPTVLGWLGHEFQWGRDAAMLSRRNAHVDEVYTTRSMADALRILQQYGVTYVIVGSVERQKYPPEGLEKFVAGLPVAADLGDATIYRVPRLAPAGGATGAP